MVYIIKINDDEQLEFLKRVVNNLHIKMHNNVSGYVEYMDTIDALKINFDNASIEKDEIIEIISDPTRNQIVEKIPKVTKSKKTVKKLEPEITKLPSYCNEHVKYTAQRAPRTDCESCWDAYKRLNPTRWAIAHRKFIRTQNVSE